MQKKLLIPILVVLLLVIVLMVRGCGNKDASQDDKQDETQDVQTDTFDNTNTTGNDVRTELGTMTANENGGVDITVTADGPQTTYRCRTRRVVRQRGQLCCLHRRDERRRHAASLPAGVWCGEIAVRCHHVPFCRRHADGGGCGVQ